MNTRTARTVIKAAAALAAAALWSSPASAEVVLLDKDGWSFSSDGRANAFYNYTFGDGRPLGGGSMGSPAPGAGIEGLVDNKNKIESSRIKSGFVSTVLGFNVKRVVNAQHTISARLAIWWNIEQRRSIGDGVNYVDGREAFLKLEGPWGAVQGGRTFGIFLRANVEIDAMYAHGNGLGHPCNVNDAGPGCGHIGFGVLYPGFTSSIRYITPPLAGFKFEGGIFDPVKLSGRFERTPLPRVEGEVSYQYLTDADPASIKVFASGTWQRLGQDNEAPQMPITLKTLDPWGVGYGVRGKAGPVQGGISGFYGGGLGINFPLENTQYPTDADLKLRHTTGWYGQVMLSIHKTDIALGAGINLLEETENDKKGGPTMVRQNQIRSQRGISAGVYQHFDALTFALEYFRADYEWLFGNKQGLNFINAGATFKW